MITQCIQVPRTPQIPQKLTVAISPKLSGFRASSAPPRRQREHHTIAEEVRIREQDNYRIREQDNYQIRELFKSMNRFNIFES